MSYTMLERCRLLYKSLVCQLFLVGDEWAQGQGRSFVL